MAAEELPDEIKRRLPDAANVSTVRAPPHHGEQLRADGFGDNLTIHRRFSLYSFNLGNESCRTSELTRRREIIRASPDQLPYETRTRRSRPNLFVCATLGARLLPLGSLVDRPSVMPTVTGNSKTE